VPETGRQGGPPIITIRPEAFEYCNNPQFIQRHAFSGAMLPTRGHPTELGRKVNLSLVRDFGFGLDYARALAELRERFWSVWERVRPMGFDERFKRLWKFYLFDCEAGFRARNIDARQVVFSRS
jgi:cyclopropane-fatty-acyl-phospholipid synthase